MTETTLKGSYRWLTHGLLPFFLLIFLLLPFVLPYWILGAGWWREFFDLAHFFSFALLAALGIFLFRPFQANGYLRAIVLSLVVLLMSASTELIQHFYHADRSGTLADVIRNCLGAVACAALCAAFSKNFSYACRISCFTLTAALLIWALTPLLTQWHWQIKREQQLPVLYDFDERWESQQVSWTHANPVSEPDWGQGRSPTLECPENIWSGIRINRVWPRWQAYGQLRLRLSATMSVDAMPLQLYVAFVDNLQQRELHWGIAYTEVHRGDSTLVIPFDDILVGNQTIDFENVRVQFLDIYKPENQPTLTLGIQEISLTNIREEAPEQ